MSDQYPLTVDFLAPPSIQERGYTFEVEQTLATTERSANVAHGISDLAMRSEVEEIDVESDFYNTFSRILYTKPTEARGLIEGGTLSTNDMTIAARLMATNLAEVDFTGLPTYRIFRNRLLNAFGGHGEAADDTQVLKTGIRPNDVVVLSGNHHSFETEHIAPSLSILAARKLLMAQPANREPVLDDKGVLVKETVGTAMLFVDLGKFKKLNDEQGHSVGDLALKKMGTEISAVLRKIGAKFDQDYFLSHRSGDEYAIALLDVHAAGAQAVTDRIADHLREVGLSHNPEMPTAELVACVAGAYAPQVSNYEEAMYLLHAADNALNIQKRPERNQRVDDPRN